MSVSFNSKQITQLVCYIVLSKPLFVTVRVFLLVEIQFIYFFLFEGLYSEAPVTGSVIYPCRI